MQRRKAAGLSQESLAERVGLSKNHISNIERGENLPTTRFLMQICDILGETPDYYLIGKITQESNDAAAIIKRLPLKSQKILLKLLKIYLDELEHG